MGLPKPSGETKFSGAHKNQVLKQQCNKIHNSTFGKMRKINNKKMAMRAWLGRRSSCRVQDVVQNTTIRAKKINNNYNNS